MKFTIVFLLLFFKGMFIVKNIALIHIMSEVSKKILPTLDSVINFVMDLIYHDMR